MNAAFHGAQSGGTYNQERFRRRGRTEEGVALYSLPISRKLKSVCALVLIFLVAAWDMPAKADSRITLIDRDKAPVKGRGQYKWKSDNWGHTLHARSKVFGAYWIVPPKIAIFEDGTLHLRVITYPGRDFSVAFRATEVGRRIRTGYRLHIQPDKANLAQFERAGQWEANLPDPKNLALEGDYRDLQGKKLPLELSAETEGAWSKQLDPWFRAWLPQLGDADLRLERAGQVLDIWITALGPWIIAHLIDGNSGETWMVLVGQDELYTQGLIGLSTYRNPTRERETLFSTMHAYPSCKTTLGQSAPTRPLLAAYDRESGRKVATATGKSAHDVEGESRFVLDVAQLESLYCKGIKPLFVTGSIPGKYWLEPVRPHPQASILPSLDSLLSDAHARFRNPEELEKLLRDLHEKYPFDTHLTQIGKSHQGRPIWAMAIGHGVGKEIPDRPAILLNGGHHGNEPMSVEFVLDAIDNLLTGPQDRLSNLVVWCVPLVNPDGLHRYLEKSAGMGSGRKNGRDGNNDGLFEGHEGVDINRNYPFRWAKLGERGSSGRGHSMYHRGEAPGSEPETKAMMNLANTHPFVASLSYHTGTLALLTPYTINGEQNPLPDVAKTIANRLVQEMSGGDPSRRIPIRRQLYPVDGTDQDWHYHTHGTLAFLVEGGSGTPSARRRDTLVKRFRPLWEALIERFLSGPSISGHVHDSEGRPLVAEIRLAEIETFEGEAWHTRCPTGRFDRFLPDSERYNVEVWVNGRKVHTEEVQSNEGRVQLNIELPTSPAISQAQCPEE